MPVYLWSGTKAGTRVNGELNGENPRDIFEKLRQRGIIPDASSIKPKALLQREVTIPGLGPRVRQKDLVVFTRQFATMVDSGLPIVQSLDILGRQADNPALKKVISGIKDTVETGGTLAEGLGRYPAIFDNLYVNMVVAGEKGGILDTIFERLSLHLEKSMKLKREVQTAMIYPAVVVGAAFIVTAVLMIFVIPTFKDMFADFGATLPMPTLIVVGISDFVSSYWHVIFALIGTSIFFLTRFSKTRRGREILHPIFLKMPIFGSLFRKVAVARFTRTLGTMVSSGVPILEALSICAKTSGNVIVERDVLKARAAISEGQSITEPLSESPVFPPMVVQMIAVGEATGALDTMLRKVADFYEEEVNIAVAGMKQLIEPLMILFLGVIIGALVIAMYLPIFKMGAIVDR
jgi:type IV pilus assembly protein PilC